MSRPGLRLFKICKVLVDSYGTDESSYRELFWLISCKLQNVVNCGQNMKIKYFFNTIHNCVKLLRHVLCTNESFYTELYFETCCSYIDTIIKSVKIS